MRKRFIAVAVFAAIALGIFFYVVPRYVDASHNTLTGAARAAPTSDLHRRLIVADLHADSLLWDRNLLQENAWGHVDVPRLIKGNIALQAFSVVTKTPRGLNIERNSAASDNIRLLSFAQRWPPRTWTSLQQRALYQAEKLHSFSPDGKRVVTASGDQTARVWDADTGKPVGEPMTHGEQVNSASFSPDGKRVVTASYNTARVWNVFWSSPARPANLIAEVCQRKLRDTVRIITEADVRAARILSHERIGEDVCDDVAPVPTR